MPICGLRHESTDIHHDQVVEAVEVKHLFNAWDVLVECADHGHALAMCGLSDLGLKRPEEVC